MLAIINADLVMKDHLIPNAYLLAENGIILEYGGMKKFCPKQDWEILDAEGAYVGPGLIDMHVHAGGDTWFYEDPVKAAEYMLKHGSTTVLPTLYFSMDRETLVKYLAKIQAAMKLPGGANIGGFYMEAPYMNPNFGADRESIPWKGEINRDEYMDVLVQAGSDVRVWVLAPEREGIEEFVKDAKRNNPNVRFAVGHSEAEPTQIEKLMPYGLCIGTHHTNATGTIVKYPECRGVCVDETVNYNREIYAEMICDSKGIHVDPYMQRLIRRIKGDDRLILISDACCGDAPAPDGYEGVMDLCFDYSGEIAGSKLTLEVACRNMMIHTGASIVDVFRFASSNPARVLGFADRGEIREGLRADLVVVDYKMQVKHVILDGRIVERAG